MGCSQDSTSGAMIVIGFLTKLLERMRRVGLLLYYLAYSTAYELRAFVSRRIAQQHRQLTHLLHERGRTNARAKRQETRHAPSLPHALGPMERRPCDDGGGDSVTANAPDCDAA